MSLYVKSGVYLHNDENPLLVRGLGFTPKVVIAWSQTEVMLKITDMAANLSLSFDNGRRETDAFSIDVDGFSNHGEILLNSGRFITSGAQLDYRFVWWVAIGGDDCFTGSYVGNGTSQTIALGFEPGILWVKGDSTGRVAIMRLNSMNSVNFGAGVGDGAMRADGTSPITGAITAVTGTNFSVGSHVEANQNGVTFWYWGIKESSPDQATGTYTGDGIGGHDLAPGLARQSRYAFVGNDIWGGIEHGAWGWGEPFSCGLDDATKGIDFTAFTVGGFSVASAQNVNTREYYWAVLAGSDLSGKNTNKVHVTQLGIEVVYTPSDIESQLTQAVLEAIVCPDSRASRISQFAIETVVEEVIGGERGLNRGMYRGIKRGFVDG